MRETSKLHKTIAVVAATLAIASLLAPSRADTYVRLIGGDQKSVPPVPASPANGVPVQVVQGSGVVSSTNPVPTQPSIGGAAASSTNPLPVYLSDSSKPTYCATLTYFTPYATPTDVLGIVGSATKVVRIHKILLSSTQTTAGINQWFVIKRGAADTGGSPSSGVNVPLDSTNGAATATVRKYTAAPTINNTVGNVRVISLLSPAPASVVGADNVLFDDSATGQPITLRGTAEELDVNFAGAAVPAGLSTAFTVEFTEE